VLFVKNSQLIGCASQPASTQKESWKLIDQAPVGESHQYCAALRLPRAEFLNNYQLTTSSNPNS
jgi:hypothetical protein